MAKRGAFINLREYVSDVVDRVRVGEALFFRDFDCLAIDLCHRNFTRRDVHAVVFLRVKCYSNFQAFGVAMSPLAVVATKVSCSQSHGISVGAGVRQVFALTVRATRIDFSCVGHLVSDLLRGFQRNQGVLHRPFPVPVEEPREDAIVAFHVGPIHDTVSYYILPHRR